MSFGPYTAGQQEYVVRNRNMGRKMKGLPVLLRYCYWFSLPHLMKPQHFCSLLNLCNPLLSSLALLQRGMQK